MDDLLDEHLGLSDDVTLLFFSRHPVTVMDRWALFEHVPSDATG
jgi:hypothetical protein